MGLERLGVGESVRVGEMAGGVRSEVGEGVGVEGVERVEVLGDERVEEGVAAFQGAEPGGVASYFLKQMGTARCSHVSH